MNNSILELQKKFNLFKTGDKRWGVVVSEINNEMQVKLQGGVLGFISQNTLDFYRRNSISLTAGKQLQFEITEVKNGIPYVSLPVTYIFANSPHKARVRFSGTQGIVVEFDWEKDINIGYYSPERGLPKELTELEENARVLCKGLTFQKEYYLIDSLQLDETKETEEITVDEEQYQQFKLPNSWCDDDIREYVKDNGGYISKGAFKVGECYVGEIANGNIVRFKDGSKAAIKKKTDGRLHSKEGDKVLVRLLKIYDFGDMKDVELLDVVDDEYVKMFTKRQNRNLLPEYVDNKQKNRHSYIDSGFVFGQRDDIIFEEGKKSGSEVNFERFWLGFLYIVKIKNSMPLLLDNNGNRVGIKLIENADYGVLSDDNVAFVRLHYIGKENGKMILTLRVEFVREYKSEDEAVFAGK